MNKRKLIIDTDGGSDDVVAIVMALRDPDVEVTAITTVVGNTNVFQATVNVLWAIEQANTYAPPVYMGATTPLMGSKPRFAWETHGSDGLGDLGYTPTKSYDLGDVSAPDGIYRHLEPGTSIVTLGPLTNIAMLHILYPSIWEHVEQVYIMGSGGLGIGNVTPLAEFNIWYDAEAAKIVLDSAAPKTFIGWDACQGEAMLSEDEVQTVFDSGELGHHMIACNSTLINLNKTRFGSGCIDFADPAAMAVVLNNEIIADSDLYHCDIVTTPGPGYGAFVIDRNNEFDIGPKNARVVTRLNANMYKDLLFKLLSEE